MIRRSHPCKNGAFQIKGIASAKAPRVGRSLGCLKVIIADNSETQKHVLSTTCCEG